MKKHLLLFTALLLCSAATSPPFGDRLWTPTTLGQLVKWIDAAPQEGLCMRADPDFAQALSADDTALLYPVATAEALKLARLHLLGCASRAQRRGWNISSDDERIDIQAMLAGALARRDLDHFFASLRPQTQDYETLRVALGKEPDP
jgi:L,D-transpeptidase YcbB